MNADDAMVHWHFLHHVRLKSAMALTCIDHLHDILLDYEGYKNNEIRFWVHSFLHHSAAVSLVFWPIKQTSKKRGEKLRNALSREEALESIKDRSLRDHIVHMDERIETWHREGSKTIVPFLFGERHPFNDDHAKEGSILEQYIPSESLYIFRGQSYNLDRLSSAISEIDNRTEEILNWSWRDTKFLQLFEKA